jgi:hypothetical protein
MIIVVGPIPVLMVANQIEHNPNNKNPHTNNQRLSTLCVMAPTSGSPTIDPIPRGATTMPAVSAV